MLSIYYDSLASQFQISGAPSVLLTPEVQLMSLSKALKVLEPSPARLREAIWRVVQGVPLDTPADPSGVSAYPTAIRPYLPGHVRDLVKLRRAFRASASGFGAALIACRDGDDPFFKGLIELLKKRFQEPADLRPDQAHSLFRIHSLLNDWLPGYLEDILQPAHIARTRAHISEIEREVGVSIATVVDGLADLAAFEQFMSQGDAFGLTVLHESANYAYPVCSIISQDFDDLVITATATTVVNAPLKKLRADTDPANWAKHSDIVTHSYYVKDPFHTGRSDQQNLASPAHGRSKYLYERVVIAWGSHSGQTATFDQVLNVTDPDHEKDVVDVEYSLCRSIKSSFLWDRRPGGILIDQGFIKVHPTGEDSWRVTVRKEVQFSNRSTTATGPGAVDFGQILNYLTPAVLAWGVECGTYSIADGAVLTNSSEGAGRAVAQLGGHP